MSDTEPSLPSISPEQAQQLFHECIEKLLRAAYLQTFTVEEQKQFVEKEIFFEKWWRVLEEIQQERVKGVLATEVLC